MYEKEQLKKESLTLLKCPFCGGNVEFQTNKSNQIIIQHFPGLGVICPTRYEAYCETFDQGREFWNKRVVLEGIEQVMQKLVVEKPMKII